MPGRTNLDRLVPAPVSNGVHNDDYEEEGAGEDVQSLPTATIEQWLMDPEPVEEWVALKTKKMKVLLRGMTEEQRQEIQRKAPRVLNKRSKVPEPDQNWINIELVRRALIEPHIPNVDMLKKALAGDIAHLAKHIGRISGFDMDPGDALE